jgi:site-specific DNA recombinase
MLEKARSGIYPSFAPVGYRNADGPNGKHIIVPDPRPDPPSTHLHERAKATTSAKPWWQTQK